MRCQQVTVSVSKEQEILQWTETAHSQQVVDCVLLYVDEVYLRGKHHRQRRSAMHNTQLEMKVNDMIHLVFMNSCHDLQLRAHGTSDSFRNIYRTLCFADQYIQSDMFVYLTYGLMYSNPTEGLKLFDEMVEQHLVLVVFILHSQITPTKTLCTSIRNLLKEKGNATDVATFEKQYDEYL